MRSLPQSTAGDWFTRNGNLAIQELLSADYDSNTGIIIGGAQDNVCFMSDPANSKSALNASSGLSARGFPGGDGGYVNIDPIRGYHFMPSQQLSIYVSTKVDFDYQQYSLGADFTGTPLDGSIQPFQPLLAMNVINPARQLACVSAPNPGCYEIGITTTGTSVKTLSSGTFFETYTFGGVRGGVKDAEVVLAISSTGTTVKILKRTSASASAPSVINGPADMSYCTGLAINPIDYFEAVVSCGQRTNYGTDVWRTTDFGTTWSVITGNLRTASQASWDPRSQSMLIVQLSGERAYLVNTTFYL
jgi:hypothetical protein